MTLNDMTPHIIYDGECPFCSHYVRMLRLRRSMGDVRLLDAREGGDLVEDVQRRGYDLDDGMVLILAGEIYHGDACIHRLALMSTGSDFFNRLNAIVFRSPKIASMLYPVLRGGRNLVLRVLRRSKISAVSPNVPSSATEA